MARGLRSVTFNFGAFQKQHNLDMRRKRDLHNENGRQENTKRLVFLGKTQIRRGKYWRERLESTGTNRIFTRWLDNREQL
eukprot:8324202-Heterocapsa_arctica.AAC.1